MKSQRYEMTLRFMLKHIDKTKLILDLGAENELSLLLKKHGYHIINTQSDLNLYPKRLRKYNTDVVTGFEILEHLIEPAQVLKNLNCKEAVFSVSIPRFLEKTYWNDEDEWDQHFHEFEPKQFNKLMKHCGFKIIHSEKWKSYTSIIGRVLLWQPKYYIVHVIKMKGNKTMFTFVNLSLEELSLIVSESGLRNAKIRGFNAGMLQIDPKMKFKQRVDILSHKFSVSEVTVRKALGELDVLLKNKI